MFSAILFGFFPVPYLYMNMQKSLGWVELGRFHSKRKLLLIEYDFILYCKFHSKRKLLLIEYGFILY
jgi:hypothetical protein